MVFLILAILCGSLFSIIFKLCQRHDVDGRQVTLFNYAVAFLFTLLPIVARTVFDPGTSASGTLVCRIHTEYRLVPGGISVRLLGSKLVCHPFGQACFCIV